MPLHNGETYLRKMYGIIIWKKISGKKNMVKNNFKINHNYVYRTKGITIHITRLSTLTNSTVYIQALTWVSRPESAHALGSYSSYT